MFRISWWALWRRIRRLLRKKAMYGLPETRKYNAGTDISKKGGLDYGKESNSITNQKALLSKYAAEHGFCNTMFFVDDGFSGTNFQDPDFWK